MGIRLAIVPLLAAALALTGCATAASEPAPAESAALEQIASLGIDTSDAAAVIEGLDRLPVAKRPSGDALIASVQPTELRIQPGDITLPLDETDFYLSIAPYVTETHPCTFHSLTTCLGELQNAPIELTVTDVATGETLVNEITATADNGFVGLWLPRERAYDVRIVSEHGIAEQRLATGSSDPTCITTMQLQ